VVGWYLHLHLVHTGRHGEAGQKGWPSPPCDWARSRHGGSGHGRGRPPTRSAA
jgi:hypothetical protein